MIEFNNSNNNNNNNGVDDINLINKIVHGHIHNYNDMTLVHGHLHNNSSDNNDNNNSFKHFEFINLNTNNNNNNNRIHSNSSNHFDEQYPASISTTNTNNNANKEAAGILTPKSPVAMAKHHSETDFDMFLDDCDCSPEIIEICCENDTHEESKRQPHIDTNESKSTTVDDSNKVYTPLASRNPGSQINPSLEQIQKDLLFLDDCNMENKELSKDVIMNFLDITKMYDVPILNKTHGKIIQQENLLKSGLPNELNNNNNSSSSSNNNDKNEELLNVKTDDIIALHNHHHHKLEIHSHGRHSHSHVRSNSHHNSSNNTHDNDKFLQLNHHFANCEHEFECQPNATHEETDLLKDENFLQFNWNEKVSTSLDSLISCKWDGCKQKFKNTMDLQSHLIMDHLGNGDCRHSKKKNDLKEAHNHQISAHPHDHIHMHTGKDLSNKKEFEEECFWDSCHFETFDICDLLDHINSTHGIDFNMSVKGSNNPLEKYTESEKEKENRNSSNNNSSSFGSMDNGKDKRIVKNEQPNDNSSLTTDLHTCHWESCRCSFGTAKELDQHLKDHLPKRLPSYDCQWSGCSKHFKQRQKLERHMKSHSCYKGFQCSLCSKCFSTSDILHQHKRKVHHNHNHQYCSSTIKSNKEMEKISNMS